MNIILNSLMAFVVLLGTNAGCGGGKKEAPQYQEDPTTTGLKNKLYGQVSGLLDIPYEDYVKRFSPSQSVNDMATGALDKYKNLIDNSDYSLTDYSDREKAYQDSVQSQFKESRDDAFNPIRESLIAEGLFGSGAGYGVMGDYAKDTAKGAADISAKLGYESIQRQQQQQQYQDALKRGDYGAMYNLALAETNRQIAPAQQATQAQLSAVGAGSGLFGQLSSADLGKYNAALNAYNAGNSGGGDMGGLGTLLGTGLGALLALPTGGMSVLAGGALGGALGGGAGSLFSN